MAREPEFELEGAAKADVYISVFPHVDELFVCDVRATLPGGPFATVVKVQDVLTSAYFKEVETRFTEILRESADIVSLLRVPERIAIVLQRRMVKHILRRALSPERLGEPPKVTIFIATGAALGMTSEQLEASLRQVLGDAADPAFISYCLDNLNRLFRREREAVKTIQREQLKDMIRGQSPLFYSLWENQGGKN